MNYTKLAVKGAAIVFVTSMFAAFLGYVTRFIMVRNLSVEDVGLFYSVFSFLSVLNVFKAIGADTALAKFIPEFLSRKDNDYVKSSIIYATIIQLVNNTILIGGVYLLSSYLGVNYFHTEKADYVLRWMALAFYIDSLTLILKYTFQGFKDMVMFSMMDVVRMSLISVTLFVGFMMDKTLTTPVMTYVAVPVIILLSFGWVMLSKTFPQFHQSKFIKDKKFFRNIVKYGFLLMSTSIGMIVLGNTDIIILTYFSGLSAVALYSVALPTGKLLMYFPRAIGGVLLPLSSELWAEGKKDVLRNGMELLYRYSFIVIVPLVMVLFSFSDLILGVFFGQSYVAASATLKILSIGMIFAAIYGVNINFFAAIGKPELNNKIIYSAALFNLVSNIIVVPKFGIEGAAMTTSISYLIMMVLGSRYMHKLIDLKFPLLVWLKTMLAGLLFVTAIFLLKNALTLNVWVETSLILFVCSIIYVTLLFFFRALNVKEIKTLLKRIF